MEQYAATAAVRDGQKSSTEKQDAANPIADPAAGEAGRLDADQHVPKPSTPPEKTGNSDGGRGPTDGTSTGGTVATAAGKSTTVGPLLTYVKYYVAKTDNIISLCLFTILTVLIGISVFLEPTASERAFASGERRMHAEQFGGISSDNGWYQWLQALLASEHERLSAAASASSSQTLLLYGFDVQLYRVKTKGCAQRDDGAAAILRAVDPRRTQGDVPCLRRFSGGNAVAERPQPSGDIAAVPVVYSRDAFTSNATSTLPTAFVAASSRAWCDDMPVRGRRATYRCSEAASQLLIDSGMLQSASGYADALAAVNELQQHRWMSQVDSAAVVVVAHFYDRREDIVLRNTMVLERLDASGIMTTQLAHSFRIPASVTTRPSARSVVSFIFDCITGIAAVLVVYHSLWRFAIALELNSRVLNCLDLSFGLDAIVFGLAVAFCIIRFQLWAEVDQNFPPDQAASRSESLHRLMALGAQDEMARFVSAWLLLAAAFRTGFSLRYISRVSLVFETVAASATDLVSTVLLSLVVVIAWALAGQLLWYPSETPLRSLGTGMFYLFQFMISMDVGSTFYDLEVTHPVATTIFFVTLFLISWCVLMNVLVGVLATAFAAAAATQVIVRRPVWTLESVVRDARSLLSRLREPSTTRVHPVLNDVSFEALLARPRPSTIISPDNVSHVMSLAGEGPFDIPERFGNRRMNMLLRIVLCGRSVRTDTLRALHLIDRLRSFKARNGNDAYITVEDACLLSLFDPSVTQRMVTKAELHVGVSDANRRRWLIMQKLIRSEKDVSAQLSVQYRQLQELTETLCGAELGAELPEAASDTDEDDDDDAFDDMADELDYAVDGDYAPNSAEFEYDDDGLDSWNGDEEQEEEETLEDDEGRDAGPSDDDGMDAGDGRVVIEDLAFSSDASRPPAARDGERTIDVHHGSADPQRGGVGEAAAAVPQQGPTSVAELEASVRRKRRQTRQLERRAFHSTMLEIHRLLREVESAAALSQQRRSTVVASINFEELEGMLAEYERLAALLGVIVL